jgi:hypothetical protein
VFTVELVQYNKTALYDFTGGSKLEHRRREAPEKTPSREWLKTVQEAGESLEKNGKES